MRFISRALQSQDVLWRHSLVALGLLPQQRQVQGIQFLLTAPTEEPPRQQALRRFVGWRRMKACQFAQAQRCGLAQAGVMKQSFFNFNLAMAKLEINTPLSLLSSMPTEH